MSNASHPALHEMGLAKFPYPHHLNPGWLLARKPADRKARIPSVQMSAILSAGERLSRTKYLPDNNEDSVGQKIGVSPFVILRREFLKLESSQRKNLKRLLRDRDFLPSAENLKSNSWHPLLKVLAGMPFGFRKMALRKFLEGIHVFGKIPVRKQSSQSDSRPCPPARITTTGPARPMGCPEKPPEGSEFILAWREGETWNWNLTEFEYGWKTVTPNRFHPRLRTECEKYIRFLRNHVHQGSSQTSAAAHGILSILDQYQHNRESNKPTDLEVGLYAGVLLARQLIYQSADELYAEKFQPKKSAWPDILRHALERHGWDLSAENLLTAIDGRLPAALPKNDPVDSNKVLDFPEWGYLPPEDVLTFGTFSRKVYDVKRKHKPH